MNTRTSIFATAVPLLLLAALPMAAADDMPTAAILASLQKTDASITADQFAAVLQDLNDDSKPDALVLMNGKSGYCGSGGCTMFVLLADGAGFRDLGTIKVVNEPVYVRATSHKGMRDLLVRVRGGGATPGFAALEFDGTAYPPGAGEATAQVTATDRLLFADPAGKGFAKTLDLQGVTFRVTSADAGGSTTVTVTPAGLEKDNSPVRATVDGEVTDAEVADLDVDGSPEIYVYVRSNGAAANGSVLAYSANKKKSLSQVYLPPLDENKKYAAGYRGGDDFAVVESVLARRFPIYSEDPKTTAPTGRTRQLQYKLRRGEAGWVLKVDRVVEY